MDRRSFLGTSALSAAFAAALASPARAALARQQAAAAPSGARAITKGRLKQSIARWCYGGIELDSLCKSAAALGYASVELLSENEWATAAKHGLACAVANGPGSIAKGWNRREHHEKLVAESKRLLPLVKAAGIPQMIVFSGNREGQADSVGLELCAEGLRKITPLAEELGVTVIMELLNSKVDHGDYQCDRTPWGAELVKRVGSPRFKLLYDIYHMQIMEGDVIRTLRDHKDAIAHYHTGGVPGRAEIDDTQELNYGAICRAIVDTGFTGYLGQEFIPRRDPIESLAQAARICDV
ncbi:MAG: hydroxypyruvate isomerase [Planctomycetota bacterium]|nr:MAG: hydroxypyruvate isomerase [Planctomycetota bacterium]